MTWGKYESMYIVRAHCTSRALSLSLLDKHEERVVDGGMV